MATISIYNQTAKLFANNEVTLANLKFMLRNSSTVFDATHTTTASLAGAEVSGNGWAVGGQAIGSAAVTTVTTNDAMLDGSDISVTASGGSIGASTCGVIYDTTASKLLFFVDFGGSLTAGVGTNFNVTWDSSGIARWTVT